MTGPTTGRRDVCSLGFGDHQLTIDRDLVDGDEDYCPVCGVTWPYVVAQAYQAGRKRGMAEIAAHFDALSGSVKPAVCGRAAQVVRRYSRSNVVTPVTEEPS